MLYSELARTYEKLETTPAKKEKTSIVAGLLKKSGEDLERVVYLLTGSVFPVWEKKEIGVAGNLMIRAISLATGFPETEVAGKFRETGDLGKTAEFCVSGKKQRSLVKRDLTVASVFDTLRKVCVQEGPGSVDRKISLVASLLSSASPLEARYITRTVLEDLRIGVAEGILRDAISQAFSVGASLVENAWYLNPNYAEIARIARDSGEEGLKKVDLEFGRPVAVLLAEKAGSLKEALRAYENFAVETKYDGLRMVIQKSGGRVWIFTRRLEDVTAQFPDVRELALKSLPDGVVVDGECVAVEGERPLPFQVLSQRIQRKHGIGKMAEKIPVRVFLFDLIYREGLLFDRPLSERRGLLEKIVRESENFRLAEHLRNPDERRAEEFYRASVSSGNEGVMVKNLDSGYHPGRRVGYWLKVKPVMENLDLVIIGAEYGTGKRAGAFSSFILGCRDPDTGEFLECGMVGTGIKEKSEEGLSFTDLTEMLKPLVESEEGKRVRVRPEVVVEVAYEEIQRSPHYSSGYALRFPRFVRLRPDKSPEEADTAERIERLFRLQRGRGVTTNE